MLYPLSYEGGGCRNMAETRWCLGLRRWLGCIWDARGARPCRDGSWRGLEAGPNVQPPLGSAGDAADQALRGGGLSSSVPVQCEAVDHQRVAEQVELLACVALAGDICGDPLNDLVHDDRRHSSTTATNPAKLGNSPSHPSIGARPMSPDLSAISTPDTATLAPSTNSAVAAQRAHCLPFATIQIDQIHPTTPSTPMTVRMISQALTAESTRGVRIGGIADPDVVAQCAGDERDDRRDDGERQAHHHRGDGRVPRCGRRRLCCPQVLCCLHGGTPFELWM